MSVPEDGYDTSVRILGGRTFLGSSTNNVKMYCSLDLPDGAVVTQIQGLFRDTGPSTSGNGLARCFFRSQLISGPDAGVSRLIDGTGTGASGTNGVETPILLTKNMGSTVVDNENNTYFIECNLYHFSGTIDLLGLYQAQVRYTVDLVPGTDG